MPQVNPNRSPQDGSLLYWGGPFVSRGQLAGGRLAAMTGKTREESHLPALDGLRGLAILLVLLFHMFARPEIQNPNWMTKTFNQVTLFGWTGVDLFFVLSGFLITRILLDAKTSTNFFKVFYMRRVLRIFPLYYLSLITVFWLWPLFKSHAGALNGNAGGHVGLTEQLWYWLNLVNWRTAFHPMIVPLLSHYWTLSIEEQFYAVWPAVVYFLNEKRLALVSMAGIVSVLILRNLPIVQAFAATHDNFLYRLTPFRMDSLLFGGLLAILYKHVDGAKLLRWAVPIFAVSLALLIWKAQPSAAQGAITFTGFAVFYSSLLTICLTSKMAGAIFRTRLLRGMGKYSYSVYLIHPSVLVLMDALVIRRLQKHLLPGHPYGAQLIFTLLNICACFGIARITWVLIESPILRLKRHFRYTYRDDQAFKSETGSVSSPVAIELG
jgi:peptidoglycan/LPS O-acetylase OafA/YrhL